MHGFHHLESILLISIYILIHGFTQANPMWTTCWLVKKEIPSLTEPITEDVHLRKTLVRAILICFTWTWTYHNNTPIRINLEAGVPVVLKRLNQGTFLVKWGNQESGIIWLSTVTWKIVGTFSMKQCSPAALVQYAETKWTVQYVEKDCAHNCP